MEVCGMLTPDQVPAAGAAAMVCPYQGAWRLTAPAADASVPQVRHAVRDLLRHQGVPTDPEVVDDLLLIVSELVTNAVRHAAVLSPQITVEVAADPHYVGVAVADNHPYRPRALAADDDACAATRTGGRGLLLVKAISQEAGGNCDVRHTATGGKVIWASLPLRRPPRG